MTNSTPREQAQTYRCADCGGEFNEGWPDEQAQQEAVENFGVRGDDPSADMVKVCDDCYKALMAREGHA